MKLHNKLASGLVALTSGLVALTSCTDDVKFGDSFIEKTPGGTVTLDTVFNSAEYTKQFLTSIYALQYYGLPYRNEDWNESRTIVPHSQCDWNSKLDALTDCYQQHFSGSAAYNQYYVGSLTSTAEPLISFRGDLVWKAVRQGFLLIENIDNVPDLTDAERSSMVAQAKCLIAARYFDLFSVYGGLPIIDHTYTGTENSLELPRASVERTVDFMVKLLDEAIPDLRWAYDGNTSDSDESNVGRWTAAGARALKAKILLIAASPLYNNAQPYYGNTTQAEQDSLVWYGDFKQERWERALQACQDFMDANAANGNYYQLWQATGTTADAYRQAYRKGYIAQESHEVIHATRVATIYGTQSTYRWWSFVGGSGPYRASYGPTQEYVNMFPWSDGKPFQGWDAEMAAGNINGAKQSDGSYDYKGKLFFENRVLRGGVVQKTASRDPRLYENAIVNGMNETLDWTTGTSTGNVYELWVGGYHEDKDVLSYADGEVTGIAEKDASRFASGYGTIKYFLGEEYHRQYMHWVYLSYDEMLLMYAECLAQCGRLSDAITQIDIVRKRVGLGGLASNNPSLDLRNNKDNLIEEILRERACELGMSNNRYYDMIRYKRTDWMTQQLHGLITYRLMANSSGKLVRKLGPYIGDDKNARVAEPSQFEFETFELQNIRRVLWGKDPNDKEVLKWLLFPFPLTEINKGYGLVQNPGW